MLTLTIKLILAHLLGDFVLQPNQWVKGKSEHPLRYLLYHGIVHAILLCVLLGFNTAYWAGALIIVLSHLLIDLAKQQLLRPGRALWLFFADQLAHLLVIAAVVYYYTPYVIPLEWLQSDPFWIMLTALVLVTFVAAIVIKVILSQWRVDITVSNNAGMYIGMLERLFIFYFVYIGSWEGVGFLLAAKSIFRFGDLNNAKDRNLTEYVLVGTLLSFGIAILIASGARVLMNG